MKVYICDVCRKQSTSEETTIGLYPYGTRGWTVRLLGGLTKEAADEKHVCSPACVGKFFDNWMNPKREKGGENA